VPAYEDGTVCSETSTYKIQTPGNYPEESIQQGDVIYRKKNFRMSLAQILNFGETTESSLN
jgi:hypothetical protein